MTTAYAVIGANYGDEGKGLVTDFLASKNPDAKVVRFSGGAQAGHTVVTPSGKRHVFGHFGAGTLAGNATYLSRYFIVNPMLFEKEFEELLSKGIVPKIEIDMNCMVTTPWDMIINRIEARGRSMSCGVGINETVTRFEQSPFKFTVGNGINVNLEGMYKDYFYQRLEKLNVKEIPKYFKEVLEQHDLAGQFRSSMLYLLERCDVVTGMPKDQDIIFEGSQGLLLDPDYGTFPYVTRTSVGVKNAMVLAKEAGIDNFHSIYVTRSYLTRHGRGPLPNEILEKPEVKENTNVTNPWQGEFRFAPLGIQALRTRIAADSIQTLDSAFKDVKRTVAITCLDHYDKVNKEGSSIGLTVLAEKDISHSLILSEGPTRKDVTTKWFNQGTNSGDSA